MEAYLNPGGWDLVLTGWDQVQTSPNEKGADGVKGGYISAGKMIYTFWERFSLLSADVSTLDAIRTFLGHALLVQNPEGVITGMGKALAQSYIFEFKL